MLVVLPNNEALGFRYDCYVNASHHFKSIIEKAEFDVTVKKASKICENVWLKKRLEETKDYNKNLRNLLYFSIFVSIIAFILLLILIYGDSSNLGLLWAAVALICITGLLTIFVVLGGLFTSPVFTDLEPTIMTELKTYFD